MFEGSVFIGPLIPGEASSLPYKLHPSDDGISTYLIDITSTTEVLHEELSVRFAGVDKGWDIKYTVQKDNKVLRSQDWSEPLTP